MAKKLDEIKEAISNNSTPVKLSYQNQNLSPSKDDLNDDSSCNDIGSGKSRRTSNEFDLWTRLSESRKSSLNNLVSLGGNGTVASQPTLPDCEYPQDEEVVFCFVFSLTLSVHCTKIRIIFKKKNYYRPMMETIVISLFS